MHVCKMHLRSISEMPPHCTLHICFVGDSNINAVVGQFKSVHAKRVVRVLFTVQTQLWHRAVAINKIAVHFAWMCHWCEHATLEQLLQDEIVSQNTHTHDDGEA